MKKSLTIYIVILCLFSCKKDLIQSPSKEEQIGEKTASPVTKLSIQDDRLVFSTLSAFEIMMNEGISLIHLIPNT
jgi:hypothetical protein